MNHIKEYNLYNQDYEIKSLDDGFPDMDVRSDAYNRELTSGEKVLLNEYIAKFDKIFTIEDDLIGDLFADICEEYNMELNYEKILERVKDDEKTEWKMKDEVTHLRSFIHLKRWYDVFRGVELSPFFDITLTPNDGPFDDVKVISNRIKMELKTFFEDYTDCEFNINFDRQHRIQIYIILPHVVVE
jgi:hypothetical protein